MSDFACGWNRFWRTFSLSWMTVTGFMAANIVSKLLAEGIIRMLSWALS